MTTTTILPQPTNLTAALAAHGEAQLLHRATSDRLRQQREELRRERSRLAKEAHRKLTRRTWNREQLREEFTPPSKEEVSAYVSDRVGNLPMQVEELVIGERAAREQVEATTIQIRRIVESDGLRWERWRERMVQAWGSGPRASEPDHVNNY
ncbi:MAG: hypothetical protein RBU30_17650 [Polyangia bacterium]|jgi:hypothetical protein|nr:hypothetical protein [Polyangia bacterium]